MNELLPGRFSETIKRLALGLEPIDHGQRMRIGHAIDVTFDTAPLKLPRPSIERHRSNLWVLLYDPKLTSLVVDLRFLDPERKFVPRRLRVPILSRTVAEMRPPRFRVRRPVLFPGAAYDLSVGATGLRGRVLRGGSAMRWARVEARLPGSGRLVGRAHGDDRGEFLLLLDAQASPAGDLDPLLSIRVTVFGPAAPPIPPDADRPKIDPLWDLPIELAASPGDPDPVCAGEVQPATYTVSIKRTVDFQLGKIISGATFNIP